VNLLEEDPYAEIERFENTFSSNPRIKKLEEIENLYQD
jgi:hypothetical protein